MQSSVGISVLNLDTPVLIVDLDSMERNISRMTKVFQEAGVAWRPHIKGLKVPAIAHRLLQAGAIGVTCAKVGEAEVMAAAGINNILIANQIVGEFKLKRLACLRRQVDVMVVVDNVDNVRQMGAIAREASVQIGVLVEIDVGLARCGVEPGEAAKNLALVVQRTEGVLFKGFMGYEGHVLTIVDSAERLRAIEASVAALRLSADLCRAAGVPVEIVSCGGTGTYSQTAFQPGVTEIQAGGGVFGDVYYRERGVEGELALSVLATVTSRPTLRRVVTDAGRKTMSRDTALPMPRDLPDVMRLRLDAEHSVIELKGPTEFPSVGERMFFLVGYGDTTVHLHDFLYGARGGVVEVVWPILGRGKLQ